MQEVYTSREVCSRCDESHARFRARAAGSMPGVRSQAAVAESSTSRSCWCKMRVTEPPSNRYEPGPDRTAHTSSEERVAELLLLWLVWLLARSLSPLLLLLLLVPVTPLLYAVADPRLEDDL